MNTEHTSLSRAPSRASARSRNSSMSRNNSLIKKNIELQDLKPADVLIERFVAWKAIVKQLTAYFEGIADIENNTAKEMNKLAGVIQVPFRAGNQFLGEGGLQDVYYDIRNKTRVIADQHADLGRTIDSSIVQHLQKLRAEIKAHIKNVQNDTGKLAATVARERELSTKLVGELANAISTFKNTPMNVQAKSDPYVANQAVARQLQRQVLEENLLQKSIVMMQQNSAHFEEGIVKSIQSAWATYDEWSARAIASSSATLASVGHGLAALRPETEWVQFAARSAHLLHPDTPLRDPSLISYPLKDDPASTPVHTGHLSRKARWTRAWGEAFFVLTPAGFLHGFSSSDAGVSGGQAPSFSLFLPQCTLGPYAGPRASQHKFNIEGRTDGQGTTAAKSGSLKSLLTGGGGGGETGGKAKSWSFRARSREEMMEWWNDIRMLCARYLVASEQVERTGPVEEAVRGVGYASDDEEDLEDEEEEELEGDDEGQDAMPLHADHEEGVRGRSQLHPNALGAPVPAHSSHSHQHPSTATHHSHPQAHAHRDEDDGSSVEEEDEAEGDAEPPLYTHPTGTTLNDPGVVPAHQTTTTHTSHAVHSDIGYHVDKAGYGAEKASYGGEEQAYPEGYESAAQEKAQLREKFAAEDREREAGLKAMLTHQVPSQNLSTPYPRNSTLSTASYLPAYVGDYPFTSTTPYPPPPPIRIAVSGGKTILSPEDAYATSAVLQRDRALHQGDAALQKSAYRAQPTMVRADSSRSEVRSEHVEVELAGPDNETLEFHAGNGEYDNEIEDSYVERGFGVLTEEPGIDRAEAQIEDEAHAEREDAEVMHQAQQPTVEDAPEDLNDSLENDDISGASVDTEFNVLGNATDASTTARTLARTLSEQTPKHQRKGHLDIRA